MAAAISRRLDAFVDAVIPLPPGQRWGWKEPNTHILLPALIRNFPDMRYIHVVHKRARSLGEQMGGRFLWLDYDQLCLKPRDGLNRLGDFLGLPCPEPDKLLAMIRPPASLGRFRHSDCSMLSSADIAVVAEYRFTKLAQSADAWPGRFYNAPALASMASDSADV